MTNSNRGKFFKFVTKVFVAALVALVGMWIYDVGGMPAVGGYEIDNWMLVIGAATLLFTGGGLVYADLSLKESRKSTKATQDGNTLQARALELEYRPVLVFKDIDFTTEGLDSREGDPVRHLASMTFVNNGKTPASVLSITIYRKYSTHPDVHPTKVGEFLTDGRVTHPPGVVSQGESVSSGAMLLSTEEFELRRRPEQDFEGLPREYADRARWDNKKYAIVVAQVSYKHAIGKDQTEFSTQVGYNVQPVLDANGKFLDFRIGRINAFDQTT